MNQETKPYTLENVTSKIKELNALRSSCTGQDIRDLDEEIDYLLGILGTLRDTTVKPIGYK